MDGVVPVEVSTGVREETVKLIWHIQNFLTVQADEHLVSQQKFQFDVGKIYGWQTTWQIGLCVVSGSIRLYLKLVNLKGGPSEVPIKFKIDIQKNNGNLPWNSEVVHKVFTKNMELFDTHALQFQLNNADTAWSSHLDFNGSLSFLICLSVLHVTGPDTPTYSHKDVISTFRKNSKDKATQNFASLLTSGNDSDVQLICSDGKVLSAHKLILKSRCPVFESMFRCDMKENQKGEIKVEDVTGPTMKIILHYLYTGELKPEWCKPENIVEFTYAAGKYQLQEILDMLDGTLGQADNDSICNTLLLSLANKLSLKNAEIRLMEQIVRLTNAARSSKDLMNLFSQYE